MFHGDFIDLVDVLVDAEGKYKISPILNIVGFWDSQNKRFVGNRVDAQPQLFTQKQASTSTSPHTYTVPTGEIWDLAIIFCSLDTDGNAANRVLDVVLTSHIISALAGIALMDITAITITANQVGGFYISEAQAPNYFKNTNTAVAVVANENALPARLEAGATAVISYSNDQAGDVLESQIWYRKLIATEDES